MTSDVLVIFGPTASGKSGAAVAVGEALGGEVINADSRQIYAKMPIITACPTLEEQKGIPHHLFEFVDPAQRMSAGKWAERALAAIDDVQSRGKVAVVVGGTGLYLRTLMEGLSEIPDVPEVAEEEFRGIEVTKLHAMLVEVDPMLAAKLHATDTQRIVRGLVVQKFTGTPLSEWQAKPGKAPPHTFKRLGLSPERDELYARIAKRWGLMEEAGLLNEITALKDEGYTLDMPGLQGLGIAEIYGFIDQRISWDEARLASVQGTRHYAKRQVTWLRNTFKPEHEFATAADLIHFIVG